MASRSDERIARGGWRTWLRWLGAILFMAAGVSHFVKPENFLRIVPPGFPAPAALVAISGACEIAGGIGLLIRRLRMIAGWGLIALLIAVFPANIFMAMNPDQIPGLSIPHWMLWVRLPLQGLFIAWVWWIAIDARALREVRSQ